MSNQNPLFETFGDDIVTCYKGHNDDLICAVAAQYFRPGQKIADVTYGKGNFWRKVNTTIYEFYPSDIITGVDFRKLPYVDDFLDVLVLDPPYVHSAGGFKIAANYNNDMITGKHADVLKLYEEGMREVGISKKVPGRKRSGLMISETKFPINQGDIIKTSYGTGPYVVISNHGPCTCPSYSDILNNNHDKMSAPHYHIICSKDSHEFYLNGYALENGRIKSVWSDDEIFIEGNVTTQLSLF